MTLDDVFVEKEEIAKDIKEQLTKSMSVFGFMIIQALVNDIDPAHKVKEAMNEINGGCMADIACCRSARLRNAH